MSGLAVLLTVDAGRCILNFDKTIIRFKVNRPKSERCLVAVLSQEGV